MFIHNTSEVATRGGLITYIHSYITNILAIRRDEMRPDGVQ